MLRLGVSGRFLIANTAARRSPVAMRFFASGSHGDDHHHEELPKENLVDVLQQRHPGKEVKQRLEQLKRNHMQFLSLDINWNYYKPEQRAEFLRQLDDLIVDGYPAWPQQKKESLSLARIDEYFDKDLKTWDSVLSKNDELQRGDWRKMSLDDKKAALYLAYGPVNVKDDNTQQVVWGTVGVIGLVAVGYFALVRWFRSKKDLPTLSPEWKAAERERFVKERMNPYSGESAHLFTAEGIKEVPE